jgi:hypothetical protein
MAARIREAELVLLDSENHIPLAHDKGWPQARAALRRFLGAKEHVLVGA